MIRDSEAKKKLLRALHEEGWSNERISKLLHEDVRTTIDEFVIRNLRSAVDEKQPHDYPSGVYGAPCRRCGTRQGWEKSCLPKREVKVDRDVLVALLGIAENSLRTPWWELTKRLASQLRTWMGRSTAHCGCDAQDADVCGAHRALNDYTALIRSMPDR